MQFDNLDDRIKYYELMLRRDRLDDLPEYPLPEGYKFVFYRDGDRDEWINIEKSAKEFDTFEKGVDAWNKYYGGKEHELPSRMVFIENGRGEKVATATAFYDAFGNDTSSDAWLHWVSVRRDCQGRGLSKPLISHTVGVMRRLGYTAAKIPTQTTSWLAVKVYLDLGFRPIPQNAVNSRDGWNIAKTLTKHPALGEFDIVGLDKILK